MNDMKQALDTAFAAPAPSGKRAFLRQCTQPAPPLYRILLTQMGYIRKWVWCVAAGIFAAAILAALTLSELTVRVISASTPLLALTLVTECGRSEHYGMTELEMATRLSLRTLVLARLGILGCFCLAVIGSLLPIALWQGTVHPIAAGLYIVTPFLMNTFVGLCIVRRFRGSEGSFLCTGVTACIVCLLLLSHPLCPALYLETAIRLWAAAALLLCWGIGKQGFGLLKQKEELTWS